MKNTTKNYIKGILTISLIGYLTFTKLDFLLFKVSICNNTKQELYVSINDRLYISSFMEKIFGTKNGTLGKYIAVGEIKTGECSEYLSMNRLTTYPVITSSSYTEKYNGIRRRQECSSSYIDNFGIRRMDFGKHQFSIQKLNYDEKINRCNLF